MRTSVLLVVAMLCLGTVHAEPVFYVTHQPSCEGYQDFLGWIDPYTGVMTPIGPLGHAIRSIAFGDDGALYGITSHELFRIDDTTGAATPVGSWGSPSLHGLTAAGPGALWSLEGPLGVDCVFNLYSIDTTNGDATLVGPLDSQGHCAAALVDIATVDGVLYAQDWEFYSIDPVGLTLTPIGGTGIWLSTAANHDGSLWSTGQASTTGLNPPQLIGIVDVATGQITETARIEYEVVPKGMAIREGTPPDSPYSPCPPPDVPATGPWGVAVLVLLIALAPLPWLLARRRRSG